MEPHLDFPVIAPWNTSQLPQLPQFQDLTCQSLSSTAEEVPNLPKSSLADSPCSGLNDSVIPQWRIALAEHSPKLKEKQIFTSR